MKVFEILTKTFDISTKIRPYNIFKILTQFCAYNVQDFDPNFRHFDYILNKMFKILPEILEILTQCFVFSNKV